MQISNDLSRPNLDRYFGEFGGILVPDAFTPEILNFAKEAEIIIPGKQFKECFETIVNDIDDPEVRIINDGNIKFYIVNSQAFYWMTAGHIALACARGSKYNHIGIENADIARFVARQFKKFGMTCTITLSAELSANKNLIYELEKIGASVDSTTCVKLYNRPQAYAFQKYLGNRTESSFIPVGTNLGPYPFPALSGLFGGQWGKKIESIIGKDNIEMVCATMLHGNAADAILRGFSGKKFATIEKPICQEYTGEFCGCLLLMVRTAAYNEYSITICPKVADMWRKAESMRLGAADYREFDAAAGISATTTRAINLIKSNVPDVKSVLVVEGENE